MKNIENDMDIYFAVGNANTLRQEKEIREILKRRNYFGWKMVTTLTSIVDMKNQFYLHIWITESIRVHGDEISKQVCQFLKVNRVNT